MPPAAFDSLWETVPATDVTVLACDAGQAAVTHLHEHYGHWLSAPERTRLAAFQREAPARLFLAGRILLRGALAARLGCEPADVQLGETGWQKPVLASHPRWHFNLSHSHGWLALALSPCGEVGVDTEWTARHNAVDKLAERYFSATERAWLAGERGEAFRERFFDIWTLKEAYIKAVGKGLAVTLEGFSFTAVDNHLQYHYDSGEPPAAAVHGWLCRAIPERPLACVLLDDARNRQAAFAEITLQGQWLRDLPVSLAT